MAETQYAHLFDPAPFWPIEVEGMQFLDRTAKNIKMKIKFLFSYRDSYSVILTQKKRFIVGMVALKW